MRYVIRHTMMSLAVASVLFVKAFPFPSSAAGSEGRFSICGKGWRYDCVVDGDTFWLRRTKIRLAEIDTPEITEAKCREERRLGERSRDRLMALLNSREWAFVFEGNDRYGRPLGTLKTGRTDIGSILIREGHARAYEGKRRPWC